MYSYKIFPKNSECEIQFLEIICKARSTISLSYGCGKENNRQALQSAWWRRAFNVSLNSSFKPSSHKPQFNNASLDQHLTSMAQNFDRGSVLELLEEDENAKPQTSSAASTSLQPPQQASAGFNLPHDSSLSSNRNSPIRSNPWSSALDDSHRTAYVTLRRSPSTQSLASTSSSATTLKKKTSMSSLQGLNGRTPPRSPISSSRRSSASFYNKSPITQDEPLPPPLSSGNVASEYFKRDLERHDTESVRMHAHQLLRKLTLY